MEYRGLERLNDAVYLAQKGDEKRCGAEIVFIRGIQFQKDKTQFPDNWLSEDGTDLWPKSWLSQSFPTAAIYLVDFDSSTSKNERKGRMDLYTTAENLLHNLLQAKIGQSPRNPVILIGQDIGGLVIKEICLQAFFEASLDTGDPMHQKERSFLQQVKGVFYFSTPHSGIRHVHWDQDYQSELMKSFMVHNKATARTNDVFRKMRKQFKWKAFGLGASHQGTEQVEEASARHDVDKFCMISASTRDICRPKDRNSSSFLLLEKFIQETLSGFKNPNRVKLPFRDDPKYVPLELSVREIRQRLQDPDIQVVVLHGDAGKGKSSLTKHVAVQYELEESESGSKSMFWDGIFYFECGRGKEARTVLQNMLRQLHVLVDGKISSSDDVDGMRQLLSERLQKLNALMIFDDVWEDDRKSLVEKVVVPEASGVKYLLSSRHEHVWRGYSTYEIEDISHATAQQIIIKHVGFPDDEIPRDLEEIVNRIIETTESHPLALATISCSVRVDREGRVRREDWEDLEANLLEYLAVDEASAKPTMFNEQYPRGVFAAMMYAVDLLRQRKDESLYLLFIMALFVSRFPTSLVHMFIFCNRPGLSKHVYRLTKGLQDRQLVQRGIDIKIEVPQPFLHNPDQLVASKISYLKMHGLRQQFIVTCADFKELVEGIKEMIAPFGGAHEFEHRAEHPSPAVLTAFCALYGIADVKNAANNALRFCNYRLKIDIPVGAIWFGRVLSNAKLLMEREVTISEQSISIPYQDLLYRTALSARLFIVGELDLHPGICLEVLMAHIEKSKHGTTANIQSALQKVVWKYMFQRQIDDESLSFLISEGYGSALTFLSHHISDMIMKLAYSEHSIDEVLSWDPISRSLAAATRTLLCSTGTRQSNIENLVVLNLLRDLAMVVRMTSGKVYVDAFDLEVLINVFCRVHVDSPDPNLFSLSSTFIQLFSSLADDVKIGFRLIHHLRERSDMQEAINSVIEKLVADLNSNSHLEKLESSSSECIDGKNLLLVYTVYQVDTVLKAVRLLCELWPRTLPEERVVATAMSISKPLQALLRSFAYRPLEEDYLYQLVHDLHWTYLFEAYGSIASPERKDQLGRSVMWSIPGATEALVSFVTRRRPEINHPLDAVNVGIRLLAARTSSAVDDDGVRSYLLTEGFVNLLVEYIGDYTAKIISGSWDGMDGYGVHGGEAVTIIESSVTSDDFAVESFRASLPKLHRVLCEFLSCASTETCTNSALTVLLYLGYSIGVNDHMQSSSCCILQAITLKHSHNAVVESSHAMKVANAFESLFGIIGNNGHSVAQEAALRLLQYLLRRHSNARARIYAVPTTATRLSRLLHGDNAGVQKLGLETIVDLSISSQADASHQFLGQVVVIPGVLERIVEFMVDDWGGRESALRFVWRYLELHPHRESASRILAVGKFNRGMVLSLQNKDDDMRSRRYTLGILVYLSRASKSCSFFLRIGGSVEALVELSSHLTRKLVEQPGPALQLVGSDQKYERKELLWCIESCLSFLGLLANESKEAASCIVASERVFDPIIDLLDDKQRETKQEESCVDPDQESCEWSAIRLVCCLAGRRRNAIPKQIHELVTRALQDRANLLTHIRGAQVRRVLKSLRLLLVAETSSAFIARTLGSVEILIPLCVHHEQRIARADALHIMLHVLMTLRFIDIQAFTRCLPKVLVIFPEIVDQMQQCLAEQDGSVELQSEVVRFLAFLAQISTEDLIHLSLDVQSKLVSILDNPQALQNLAGLLRRDDQDQDVIITQKLVMYVLCATAKDTVKGMFQIVRNPGEPLHSRYERVVELLFRGNADAFLFVQKVISTGKLYASAPLYLLPYLCRVVSANMGKSIGSEALNLLGQCALQNRNALHYLIDMLHQRVRCVLRAEAMNYLISHASDNLELPTRTFFASMQSLAYDPTRHECVGPACDLQEVVLCVLVSLVERSPQTQWQIAKYVTGLSARDVRMYMPMKAYDKPDLKRKRSMDTASSEFIPAVKNYRSQKVLLLLLFVFSLLLIFGMYTSQKT